MPPDFEIADMSCLHVGSANCHYEGIKEIVYWVQHGKYRYINLKGDLIEAITPKDKRFKMRSIDTRFKTPADEVEYLVEIFKPVADHIIGCCLGNHELKVIDYLDCVEEFTKKLNIRHTYGAGIYKFIPLRKNKPMHKYLFLHGSRYLPKGAKDPVQRKANREAAQKRILEELGHADCIYASQGHHHQICIVKPTATDQLYLTDDGTKIKQHYRVLSKQNADYIPSESRWFCGTGSYRKSLTRPGSFALDYSEGRYAPTELGCVKIIVRDGNIIDVLPSIVNHEEGEI